ncbi:protein BTN1 [Suhomyces tanzawaensis NRRL Y-17324]|uniref:Protein BTN n=1 Tax=Suhomyces tanzawaensis NRRL Y-17324 TaxID=984487 RepID=A0A1E4SGL1_9ASCO|nr:protein BTN1 [Suhomyces tanzawaensis NRRL Y-17324]ODV78552.1 protein BTN1 [Suhomyces tanzawaensis NRRL Y-17324]
MLFPESTRVFVSFFVFGLLNNILYVVILSAAIDLVGSSTPKAVVLLADIIPSFTIKLTAPFFVHLLPYQTRIWLLVGLSSVGMLVISLSHAIPLKIVGIALASLSSGLGESTFLQLTHFYREEWAIGGFSSGTGGAGLFGSFLFMFMTNVLGMKVWVVLFLFSVAPFGFIGVFYGALPKPEASSGFPGLDLERPSSSYQFIGSDPDISAEEEAASGSITTTAHVMATINKIKPLVLPYMVPLSSVYISEYVINQGISPTLLFPLEDLPRWLFSSYRDIYVVYGFLYQLGVFVSRSSVNFGIRIKNLYWLSALQFFNVLITLCQSTYDVPFSLIWLLLVLVFYEGLLGGFLYINTFMSVSEEVPLSRREFSMGAVSISDSFGVVMAGCINWWLEAKLCGWQVQRGRDWCRYGGTA